MFSPEPLDRFTILCMLRTKHSTKIIRLLCGDRVLCRARTANDEKPCQAYDTSIHTNLDLVISSSNEAAVVDCAIIVG